MGLLKEDPYGTVTGRPNFGKIICKINWTCGLFSKISTVVVAMRNNEQEPFMSWNLSFNPRNSHLKLLVLRSYLLCTVLWPSFHMCIFGLGTRNQILLYLHGMFTCNCDLLSGVWCKGLQLQQRIYVLIQLSYGTWTADTVIGELSQ